MWADDIRTCDTVRYNFVMEFQKGWRWYFYLSDLNVSAVGFGGFSPAAFHPLTYAQLHNRRLVRYEKNRPFPPFSQPFAWTIRRVNDRMAIVTPVLSHRHLLWTGLLSDEVNGFFFSLLGRYQCQTDRDIWTMKSNARTLCTNETRSQTYLLDRLSSTHQVDWMRENKIGLNG